MTPTARTLKRLRADGWECWVVERRIGMPKKGGKPGEMTSFLRDCFGFGDVLGCHPREKAILLVQCTSLPNVASRLGKVRSLITARLWLLSGGRIQVWGWKGKEVRIVEVTGEELAANVLENPRRRKPRNWEQGELFA